MGIRLDEIRDPQLRARIDRALDAAAQGVISEGIDNLAARLLDAQPQPRDERKPARKDRPEKRSGPRVVLRVVRCATRLLDVDNLGGAKFLIDAIRRSGLIRDDDPETVEIQLLQEHVKTRAEQGVRIEIV